MEEILEEFERIKNNLIKRKTTEEKNLQKLIEKYNNIESSEIDKKEKRLEIVQESISIKKRLLSIIEGQLEFLRPSNEKDMEYRNRQYNEFSKEIGDLVPKDLQLRFHGCPIYFAKQIIESGEISSSVDRLGVETSFDSGGQISVTTRDTLSTTIEGYIDLTKKFLPAGCVFVLLPKDELDAKCESSLAMGNVNFRQEPNRLYGIITTPENIEMVSQWAKINGIDLSKIYDFDRFVRLFKKQKDELPDGKSGIDDAMDGGIRRGEVIETTNTLNNAVSRQENELNQKNTNEQGDKD